jgi:amino acid adenylation domain-containing protein
MTAGLHQLVEAQADRTPDAVAIVHGRTQLSYRELDERANQVAHQLHRLGVGPEEIVGVCLERSPQLIVGLLGVLKAGAAYLPLDPRYPADRLAYMLRDAGASFVITSAELAETVAVPGVRSLPLPEGDGSVEPPRTDGAGQDNLAYVIYTSGSSGRPKGVQVEHRSLVAFARSSVVEYDLSRSDRVLQFASASFDASAEEIYPTLTAGATLVLRTDACLASPEIFLASCREWGITVLDLPTAYWHELTSALQRNPLLQLPSTLRLVIIGGEAARADRVAAWTSSVASQVRLVNTYGPTEATVVATATTLKSSSRIASIGQPVHGACAHVLDASFEPVPVGVDGELYIGGTGLARGYLRRPALTAERFVPDPFSRWPGRRLYRTGDLARWRADGQLEFRGRVDRQVKLRGFRIELEEIEAALGRLQGVSAAVVMLREDTPGQPQLVAYVVPTATPPSASELRAALVEMLPGYMVPGAFLFLSALPLTPNGKLDREALAAPEAPAHGPPAQPMTELESSIAAIWRDVLDLQHVDVDDHFFDLGGYSLKAFQVIGRIGTAHGVDLPAHALFTAPTVGELARIVAEQQLARADPDVLAALLGELSAVSCQPSASSYEPSAVSSAHLSANHAHAGTLSYGSNELPPEALRTDR